MKTIRFFYKIILYLALAISIILSFNVFGIEFIHPYIFLHYEYKKSYPNIRYYEDVVPIENGLAIVYRGKIGKLESDSLTWTKIAYQNHRVYSDGKSAVAYVQGGKYLHIISSQWQKDILYPVNIEKVRVKNGNVLVLLSSQNEDYLIMYDKNQNIIFSVKYKEKVIDCDFNGIFAIAILKPRDSNELAISFADKRGIYMTKVLPPSLQNVKRCYAIEDYILMYNQKVIEVYDLKIQKKIKTFSFAVPPEYVIGNTNVLFAEHRFLVYNKLRKNFVFKQIEDFNSVCADAEKIVTSKGNEIRIYSMNLNRIKTLKVNSFGFVKAVISTDKLYYIYNDRIELYQERW
ncbi:hypothetical protein [Caldicellulosiruptor naganoensis]|uniref:Uncharacterized protein n=1 Tax=Caldicellulosiruptor naganoensis TaxID=29324 RepID=A0ABY7BGN2_9FIRM|nr:hypothetical protein [Caldicellulosiruptor naganoensis]WAM31558.1 hypothetical protein OTJ99_002456 [Caldicellulosiruptor naganoensis]